MDNISVVPHGFGGERAAANDHPVEGIGGQLVAANERTMVVADNVIDHYRLGAADKNHSVIVGAAAVAVGQTAAGCIELQYVAGNANVGLLHLDGIKAVKAAFD